MNTETEIFRGKEASCVNLFTSSSEKKKVKKQMWQNDNILRI